MSRAGNSKFFVKSLKSKGSVFCLATWFVKEFLWGNANIVSKIFKRIPLCDVFSSFILKVFALDGQWKVKEK